MKKFFKRLGAFFIDLMLVTMVANLISGIGAINPQMKKYNEYYNDYENLYSSYTSIIKDLNTYNSDEVISTEEFGTLKENYPIFIEVLDKYDNESYDSSKYNDIKTDITDVFNTEYQSVSFHLEHYMTFYHITYIVLIILYFGVFTLFTNGQTLGKKLFKLAVVKVDNSKCTFINYLIRSIIMYNVVFIIINMILSSTLSLNDFISSTNVVGMISNIIQYATLFMIIMRTDGRGLHDLAAGTKVISLDEENAEPITSEKTNTTSDVKEIKSEAVTKERGRKRNSNKEDIPDAVIEEKSSKKKKDSDK